MQYQPDKKIAVLVPWRDIGDPARRENWKLVRQHWERNHPSYWLVARDGGGTPFSRAASLNLAARDAPFADIFIVADADVVTVPSQVEQAVQMVSERADGFVQPFDRYIPLSHKQTKEVWADGGVPAHFSLFPVASWDCVSACLVMSRASWQMVGGFDEGFRGWGYEDSAFDRKMAALTKRARRQITGPAWHLAHRGAVEDPVNSAGVAANKARYEEYERDYPT